ncbi:MAG: hypothetical protein AAGA90_11175 [Actinomycetota bacterium]
MPVPPRTPVLVGRSQIVGPAPDVDEPLTVDRLMTDAAIAALDDAGISASELDLVGVVTGLFRHPNIGQAVARSIGAPDAHTVLTTWGGNTPIAFVGDLGDRVASGEIDVALVLGGEVNATRDAVRRAGGHAPHPTDDGDHDEPETWGAPLVMADPVDRDRGGDLPINTYAVFESALRAAAGQSLDTSRDEAARLWAGYAAAAAVNPDLATHEPMTAEEIRTPTATNRMVSWPYTKAMCANNRVDHAGALVLTCHEVADRLGVPADRRVYVHDLVTASDTDTFLTRRAIDEVPALDAATADLRARWSPSDRITHVDLYGCFPSIVRYTAAGLGLDPERPLTVSGGLGFMGAPLNFAAGQSLIAIVRTLRDDPGSFGLVQGKGGHAAKHAFGVFSTVPPDTETRTRSLPDAAPDRPRADADASGPATIDGITVEYGRDGAHRAVAICRFDDGARLWATSDDPAVFEAATTRELVGESVTVTDGVFSL